MLRLLIQNGTNSGVQLQLEQGWLLLGRGEESVLRFVEPSVSTRHAIIATEQDEFFVLDQNSRNGTFLNGERVQTARLTHGDVIELGPFGPRLHVTIDLRRQFADEISEAETSPQFIDTARLRSPQTAQWTIREAAQTIGLYNPAHDSGDTPPSAGIGLLMLFCGVLGVVLLALTFLNFGLTVSVVAGVAAFVPAAVYLGMFLWLDRFDPEPVRNLVFAFAWGAVVAVFVSGLVNEIFKLAFASEFLTSVVSAPIIEEASKALGVLLIALLFRRDFDSVVDGIIYAGVVALGFATMENVGYYGDSLAKEGTEGLIGTFILRGLFAPFSHVLFTCMTGIGVGVARETHQPLLKLFAPLAGCCAAMFLHALWNTLASFSAGVFWMGYLLLELPLFLGLLGLIAFLVRREGRILKQTLATEVERGLISREQLETAISVFRRSRWVLAALGNRQVFDARRQFLRAVAKLGLCQWHGSRAVTAGSQTGSFSLIPKLRAEVFRLRDEIG